MWVEELTDHPLQKESGMMLAFMANLAGGWGLLHRFGVAYYSWGWILMSLLGIALLYYSWPRYRSRDKHPMVVMAVYTILAAVVGAIAFYWKYHA
jgi:uncharacterized BrkB/YihY/UPF0761 family membrane protein